MPYSIKLNGGTKEAAEFVRGVLSERLNKDGRFRAELGEIEGMRLGPKEGSRKPGFGFTVTRVRLTVKKEYCGQHPGVCLVNPLFGQRKKMKATYLEWNDWVEFNGLVNDVLDELRLDADVWSRPMETTGRMWMRKGKARRLRYDHTEQYQPGRFLPLRIWNHGSKDQFS